MLGESGEAMSDVDASVEPPLVVLEPHDAATDTSGTERESAMTLRRMRRRVSSDMAAPFATE
jgi:hypothetical protein